MELIDVIREVHSQHADDLCWMDIDRIFAAAGLPVPDRRVGDRQAMKRNCDRYIDTMCQDGEWKSYADLEKELRQLKESVAAVVEAVAAYDEDDSESNLYDVLRAAKALARWR